MKTLFTFVLAVCLMVPLAAADYGVPVYQTDDFADWTEISAGYYDGEDVWHSGLGNWDQDAGETTGVGEIDWSEIAWQDHELGDGADVLPQAGLVVLDYLDPSHQHYDKLARLRLDIRGAEEQHDGDWDWPEGELDAGFHATMANRTYGTGELMGIYADPRADGTEVRYVPLYDSFAGFRLRSGNVTMQNSTVYATDLQFSQSWGTQSTLTLEDSHMTVRSGSTSTGSNAPVRLGRGWISETGLILSGESSFTVYAEHATSPQQDWEDPVLLGEGGYGSVTTREQVGETLISLDGSNIAWDSGTLDLGNRTDGWTTFRFISDEDGISTINVHGATGIIGAPLVHLDFQLGAAPDPEQVFVLFNLTDENAVWIDFGWDVRMYDMDWNTLEEGDYIGLEYEGTTYDYYITYQYGDGGNNVALVPEPATVALLTLGGLFAIRRRRNA